ncbi:MAG: acyl-CoA dehydratase activase [Actinobacteria bacterium]|nr:acyl-CoA dehydratase activase [Actinomycetota bacterium]
MKEKYYLGVDVGSVSTNLVLINDKLEVKAYVYERTRGEPIKAVQNGLKLLVEKMGREVPVFGAGTTGSARQLSATIVGADVVRNEITAHAVAAIHEVPNVRTVLEIGGQDSKIIIIRDGVVVDFAMNTVCAAGTGSFLDHQAQRLGIPIEDFGDMALKAEKGTRIAGRCTVFAESDMIHKQQVGHPIEEIIYGLCQALVRNYLNNLAKGKEIEAPIVFQGGVAANKGIKRAFEEAIQHEIIIPTFYNVMGAIGAAILAKEKTDRTGKTNFRGFEAAEFSFQTSSFECHHCSNHCEVVSMKLDGKTVANWGGRCGRWEIGEVERLDFTVS